MARVVLTQPLPRVARIAEGLRARGHEALELPFTRIFPVLDAQGAQQARAAIEGCDWVVLPSPAAVQAAAGLTGGRWPFAAGIALVGPGSLEAARECGLVEGSLVEAGPVAGGARWIMPPGPRFDADALAATPPFDAPAGLRVLVLRGESGSDDWIARLRERGAAVRVLAAYRREACMPGTGQVERLRAWAGEGAQVSFLLTVSDSVERLAALLREAGLFDWASRQRALAIHPRIAAALRASGWRDVRTIGPGESALAAALE